MSTLLIYVFCWFGLMVVAILNGILRNFVYGKWMTEIRAHQLSTIIGIVLVGLAVYAMNLKWAIESKKQAIFIGLIWLAMTILFEFVFGHYVVQHPWEKLFHDYRLDQGRVWLLFLLWTAIVPYFIFKISS